MVGVVAVVVVVVVVAAVAVAVAVAVVVAVAGLHDSIAALEAILRKPPPGTLARGLVVPVGLQRV